MNGNYCFIRQLNGIQSMKSVFYTLYTVLFAVFMTDHFLILSSAVLFSVLCRYFFVAI